MKDLLLKVISCDKSYNKSATRYLYKTHPELWQNILEYTSFLPENAPPKQRVWHVLNDITEIPICPVTGEKVKWWENRYLGTFDRSSRTTFLNLQGKTKNQTESAKRKRAESNRRTSSAGLRKKPVLTEEQKQERVRKSKETSLKRYGVTNGSKTLEARKKISDSQIKNGATPKHLRSLRRLYCESVRRFTEESWSLHFQKINPLRVNRSKNSLDHIYSIQQGFLDNIPPYIIGHWTNLRVIPLSENSSKGMRCDKTQEELFDDFFNYEADK